MNDRILAAKAALAKLSKIGPVTVGGTVYKPCYLDSLALHYKGPRGGIKTAVWVANAKVKELGECEMAFELFDNSSLNKPGKFFAVVDGKAIDCKRA